MKRLLRLILVIPVIFLATGISSCAVRREGQKSIPPNTQLAISSDGARLLVTWNDESKRLHARMATLSGGRISSWDEMSLPPSTLATAFSLDGNNFLITTLDQTGASDLIQVKIEDNSKKLIYRSAASIRFPIEVEVGDYVFLEGIEDDRRNSHWRRYRDGNSIALNKKIYNAASRLSLTGGNLYLLEPWSPPAFRALLGSVPVEAQSLLNKSIFSAKCSDAKNFSCLTTELILRDGGYLSRVKISNGARGCEVKREWLDLREGVISRNGKIAVFHVALSNEMQGRAIIVVDNNNFNCVASENFIKGF